MGVDQDWCRVLKYCFEVFVLYFSTLVFYFSKFIIQNMITIVIVYAKKNINFLCNVLTLEISSWNQTSTN